MTFVEELPIERGLNEERGEKKAGGAAEPGDF